MQHKTRIGVMTSLIIYAILKIIHEIKLCFGRTVEAIPSSKDTKTIPYIACTPIYSIYTNFSLNTKFTLFHVDMSHRKSTRFFP